MDNALARLLGQEPLESLDGPGKEHMIDEILNVLSHAEDEGSSSSQENTPQHTTQHTAPPVITKQTLPSLSTILSTTGTGKKDAPPGLNTTAATATTTLGYQAPYPTPTVTTGNLGTFAYKAATNPLALPPYQTVTIRTSSVEGDIEDGDGDEVESPLSSEDEEDSPSPGTTPVKLPSFPTLTSSAALRYTDSTRSSFLSVAQLARDNLPATHDYLRASLPSAHTLQQFISQRSVASFPDAREVLAAKAEPMPESQPSYDQAAFIETTTPEVTSVNRYQSHSVRDYIVTTATETKPKYPTYESPITRAAEVVANTPTKSALHATLHGEYQPASSAADSSAEEDTYRSYTRAAEPELNVKTLPTRPAAPLDYLAAAAARYEYQHYPKGIALAKSSQSTDYKVALTTSPSTYRHTLPQTVQAAGLMSSAAFAFKAQLENEAKEAMMGSQALGTTNDKYIGIPHDELALKTEVYGDRTTFEKEYTESTHAHTITTAEHAQVTLPSSDYILSSRDTESAASQISQIQAALANHSQHAEAQAALAKMHSEIVKTVTTSAGHAPSSTTVAGRQFVTGTVSEGLPQQQAPPVTTTASHLEIMKLPKKRGRPPKGPDDFSPPLPTIPAHTSAAATTMSSIHQRPPPPSSMPKHDRPPPAIPPQVTPPPSRVDGGLAPGDQICINCGQYFSSSLMFEKHVSSRTCERYKGPYNCPKCTKQFTRRFNLQLHLQKGCAKKKRNSYWPANKEEYEEYATREQMQQKVQLNQGKRKSGIWHKCGKCGQAFTDAQVYNSHIAICLAGKKLFKCKYCPKQFSRRSGNLQIHMLTCPAKVAFEAAGGDDENPPPEYDGRSYDPYKQSDQWSRTEPQPPQPRKKPRRPKVPKTQDSVRSALDMSLHTVGHEGQYYAKMHMEPPPPFPPPPPEPPTLPLFQPQPEPQEQKFSHQELLQATELQQLILQREQELIKQERLIQQQEEQLQMEEQMAQEVPQQEEVVPPPLAVVESVVPQEDILTENSVSDVAANVAISTEPPPVEVPKKRRRSSKGRTSSTEMNVMLPPVADVPFIPEPQVTPLKPIKVEEKPKSNSRKRKLSENAHQTSTRGTLNRIEQNQTRGTKAKPVEQLPAETPGSKINYATTTITTENVIPYKRHKKRPNYALMNDDAEDGASRNRKSDVNITPEVPPRSKRSRTTSAQQQDVDDEADDDDDEDDDDDDEDAFTPKHVSRRAAKLKQGNSEPDYVAISGGTSYRCKCGKVCRRQADITRHLEFCKFGSKIEKPYACACGLRYVNQVSVKRHQQLTKCVGYEMGAKGTTSIIKTETSTTPNQTAVKTERLGGRKRTPIEQILTDSTSQEGSDSSYSAGVDSGHATPGSSSEATTSDATTLSSLDSPQKLAEHKKHYRCSTCHRKFVNRKTYQRHKTIYCSNQTHECPTCKETFTSATVLGFHQMEHQEELPFGCSICGSKFKSASTLSRHRESHAQVKKPIKKLKIKIVDGSCIISKVDSPAGAQRDRESRDNSPATRVKIENQGSAVLDGTIKSNATVSAAQVSKKSVINSDLGQNDEKDQAGETYMVEISTVEDNILLPNQSDVMEDAVFVPHPTNVITEAGVVPAQPDVIEEPVVETEGTLMISNEDGVVTFSESTNSKQIIQNTDEYLTPVSEASAWTGMTAVDALPNHGDIPAVQHIPGAPHVVETPVTEASEGVVQSEIPAVGVAVITEQINDATVGGGAPDITQFSALPAEDDALPHEETVQETDVVKQEVRSVINAPNVAPETNVVRETSVIEIVPTVVKVGEDIEHVLDAPKVSEAMLSGGVNHENGAQQTIAQVNNETCENGEVHTAHETKSIVTTTQ